MKFEDLDENKIWVKVRPDLEDVIFNPLNPTKGVFLRRGQYRHSFDVTNIQITPVDRSYRKATEEEANKYLEHFGQKVIDSLSGYFYVETVYTKSIIKLTKGYTNTKNRDILNEDWFEMYEQVSDFGRLQLIRVATPEEITHYDACAKAGKYVEPLVSSNKLLDTSGNPLIKGHFYRWSDSLFKYGYDKCITNYFVSETGGLVDKTSWLCVSWLSTRFHKSK